MVGEDDAPRIDPRDGRIERAARDIHREILNGRDCPYVTRRGVVLVDSWGKMIRSIRGTDSTWERAKVLSDSGLRDRSLHPLTIASHVKARAEVAVVLPPETSWAVIDLDCHLKDASWEYVSRVKIATSFVVKWVRLQGAEPVVLTSPGGGYHVWIKMDQRWPGERLREALKRDVTAFLKAAGVTMPGEGELARERTVLGVDWYPGNHAIRVPGGRGQVLLDPSTLRPVPGTIRGKFKRGTRPQRNVARNAELTAQALIDAFPVPTRNQSGDADRWDGIDPFDLFDDDSPEFAALCDRFENSFLGVGSEINHPRIPVEIRPEAIQLESESPVSLCREIVRGAAFREMLEAAESFGIAVGGGSTEAFSAGAKIGWRARTLGIASETDLVAYVSEILEKSSLEAVQEDDVRAGALKRWRFNDGVQAMRAVETDPERWVIELTSRGRAMAHALEIGFLEMAEHSEVAEHAATLIAWTLSTGETISRHHVYALCGGRRVPGTRSRIEAAVKAFLREEGLTRISKRYRPGRNVTLYEPTANAWLTLVRVRFVAGRFIDGKALEESVPKEFRKQAHEAIFSWTLAARGRPGAMMTMAHERAGPVGLSTAGILTRLAENPIDRTDLALL